MARNRDKMVGVVPLGCSHWTFDEFIRTRIGGSTSRQEYFQAGVLPGRQVVRCTFSISLIP